MMHLILIHISKMAVIIVLCLLINTPLTGYAKEPLLAKEYQAKVALIYNFAKFVEWPDDTFSDDKSPLVLGVLGPFAFKDELNKISAKKIGGRPIKIRYFSSMSDYRQCQILCCNLDDFLQFSVNQTHRLEKQHVLTVGDNDGFGKAGGILSLILKDGHLAFKVNIDSARKANLSISANALRLATAIIGKGK